MMLNVNIHGLFEIMSAKMGSPILWSAVTPSVDNSNYFGASYGGSVNNKEINVYKHFWE